MTLSNLSVIKLVVPPVSNTRLIRGYLVGGGLNEAEEH